MSTEEYTYRTVHSFVKRRQYKACPTTAKGRTIAKEASMMRTILGAILISAAASSGWGQVQPVSMQLSGNGILEPGEAVGVSTTYRNSGPIIMCAPSSTLSNFEGPPGPTYEIVDGDGGHGCFPPFSGPHTCVDCYTIRITTPSRPAVHWDTTADELIGFIGGNTWTFHVGATFTDVPEASPFYRFVEALVHKDVTTGCTSSEYCPAAPVTREAMSVFLLVAKEPRGYAPAACASTPAFADVPVSSPYCRWVEELARRGTVAGCGGGLYCPTSSVTREQMAVFLLAGGATPPDCTAAPFLDVPVASPFCRWILQLTQMGITAGCGGGNYCPEADVTREQMAAFLATRFQLTTTTP
jgi:hypothetical protein